MSGDYLKGNIGGIQRFSVSDGPGIRTTVFLKGCPLKCKWCHNPELISFQQNLMYTKSRCIGCGYCIQACRQAALTMEEDGISVDRARCRKCLECTQVCPGHALRPVMETKTVEEIMELVMRDRIYYKESGGGVTISGGELLCQGKFAQDLLRACHKEEITVAIDTSGYGDGDLLYELAKEGDYILYDIKSSIDETHQLMTGVSNKLIQQNLKRISAEPSIAEKIIIRMPLISGINDTEEDITAACRFLKGLGLKKATLHPYHDLGISKSRGLGEAVTRYTPPDEKRLREIQKQLEEIGIFAVLSDEEIVD